MGYEFFVRLDLHLDILRSICILQGVDGLLILVACRTYRGDHDSLAVAAETVLEHSCELGVSERHETSFLRLVAQGVDAVGQGQQGGVDLGSLH